jgi:hypothetical protein
MGRKKKRTICPHNIAWLRLANGTLRVDLDTSEVFSLHNGRWRKVTFHETQPRTWYGESHYGGYYSAKLRITIDGVYYRQHVFLHRVVWMAKHRQELLPTDQVDHGSLGKACNHWSNLEKVTPQENCRRRDRVSAELAATYGEF